MFKNLLIVSLRNIRRNKLYSGLNIAGLALGMACAILIGLFIQYELSFDRFHKNADRIQRVVIDATVQQKKVKIPAAQMAFGPALAKDFPEVADAVRIFPLSKTMVSYSDRTFYETAMFYTDATVFNVFTFPLIAGEAGTALVRANTVVLTERVARKYFQDENPVGKFLRFNGETDFVVTGVMKDIPGQSHFQFDFLVSLETLFDQNPDLRQDWVNVNTPTYILFHDPLGPKRIGPKVVALIDQRAGSFLKAMGATLDYSFQPLTRIHLFSRFDIDFVANSGSIQYVTAFAVIALFIIGIACMNFMNLATARSAKRAREIGLRKVAGARRSELFGQFMGEAAIHTLLALMVALLLVCIALPLFKSISGIDLQFGVSQMAWLGPSLLGLALFVTLAAGIYPAVYLSALRPSSTLKSRWKSEHGGARFRHILVVVQFFIGIALIIGTGVVRRQLDFIRSRDLGFSAEQVLVTRIEDPTMFGRIESVKARLREIPGVVSAAMTQAVPGQMAESNVQPFVPEGFNESEPLLFRQFSVDEDFVPTIGLEIVKGRNFSKELSTDTDAILINEATVRKLGWADPVGRKIKMPTPGDAGFGWREKTVVGVVRDFHFLGLRDLIEPILLDLSTEEHQLLIKLKTENLGSTIDELQRAWREIDPVRPLDFFFLDGFFEAQYRAEERLGRLVAIFSVLSIAIACLGLFGLTSFLAEQRTNEIGIRKVLGASSPGIIMMLSRDFLKWIVVANVIAWPIAYGFMNKWLQNYAYRIRMNVWIFIVSGTAALAIALLTVGYQSIRAARANPADSLRHE